MKWIKENQNPGFSVYHATPDDKPNTLYVISKKTAGTGLWKVFVREAAGAKLRTIYIDKTLAAAKKFVADFEEIRASTA